MQMIVLKGKYEKNGCANLEAKLTVSSLVLVFFLIRFRKWTEKIDFKNDI